MRGSSTIARVAQPPVLLCLAAALLSAGCGKKGPPRPPLRSVPAQAQQVRARQIGDQVMVRAVIPRVRADGSPLGEEIAVLVLRMPATGNLAPGAVSPRYLMARFAREARPLVVLKGAALEEAAPAGRLTFADVFALGDAGGVPARYLYGVEVREKETRHGAISTPVAIDVGPPLAAPSALRIETAEGEVSLAWEPAPALGEGATAPGAAGGARSHYNVYRRGTAEVGPGETPRNPFPLEQASWTDRDFAYGQDYAYSVRAVTATPTGLRESAATPEVTITPRDVYAPAAPGGLAAAVEGRVIKIYWFPNDEADLGGYRIHRRQSGAEEFGLLDVVDAAATSFVDATALPGLRYDYRVTAIDRADPPNESSPSEAVREMVPVGVPGTSPAGPLAKPTPPAPKDDR